MAACHPRPCYAGPRHIVMGAVSQRLSHVLCDRCCGRRRGTALFSCIIRGRPVPTLYYQEQPMPSEPLSVILIQLDSLNRHFLSCYGNDWIAAPNLTEFARRAAIFDRHYTGS